MGISLMDLEAISSKLTSADRLRNHTHALLRFSSEVLLIAQNNFNNGLKATVDWFRMFR